METLVKADIFFFVTTIAVVLVSIFLGVALYYAIVALRKIRELCDMVEKNIDTTNEELKGIISRIKESFLFNLLFAKKTLKKKRSS